MSDSIAQIIARLPKCELHLHIEGCLEPELMLRLADRNKVPLRYRTIEAVRAAYNFTNLKSFLDIYYEGTSVLRRGEDYYDLASSYFAKAAEQNVRHAEVFFDPQTHTSRGIPFEAVLDGLSEACEDAHRNRKVSSGLILCFLRHLSADAAMDTLRQALHFKEKIIGVGIDSYEVGNPAAKFAAVFKQARRHGFLCVAHAGQEGPASYVSEALRELKVKRIDHGVRSLEDPTLVKRLASGRIPLTVCPLSNVRLGLFPDMQSHCLKKMLERNLLVTINSDDPAYFGGYVNENFVAAADALKLTRDDVVLLARNSFEASFLSGEDKAAGLREIAAVTGKGSRPWPAGS